MQILLCIVALVWLLPSTVSGNIYGYQDDTGAYHFTNIKPANKKYTIVIETKDPQRGPVQGLGHPWQSDEERQSLIRQAKGLLGVPYKLGGEGLAGIDCSAFVKKMFSSFDVLLPRTAREQYDIGREDHAGSTLDGRSGLLQDQTARATPDARGYLYGQ